MNKEQTQKISQLLTVIYAEIIQVEQRELRKSTFNDVSIHEMHAVNAITMYEHKTSSQLAKELKISPGTVTSMINNLVRKGYVIRIRGNDDRRFVRLGLTRKGRLLYRAHDAFHRSLVKSFIQGFSDEQIVWIEKALLNLHAFLEYPPDSQTNKE